MSALLRKDIPLLAGIALMGVIFDHTVWAFIPLLPVQHPLGYLWIALDETIHFVVPAFLFTCGMFIAYSTKAGKEDLSWNMIRSRIVNLIWPYLIWMIVHFLMYLAVSFSDLSLARVSDIFLMSVVRYEFVPVLILFYALAQLMVKLMRVDYRRLLLLALIIQIVGIIFFYLDDYQIIFRELTHPVLYLPKQIFFRYFMPTALYFPLGLVASAYATSLAQPLRNLKPWWPVLAIVTYALSVAESFWLYSSGMDSWAQGTFFTKASSALYSLVIIFWYLAGSLSNIPFKRWVFKLGNRAYGVFVSHYIFLGVSNFILEKLLPSLYSHYWLSMPIVFLLTLVTTVYVMELILRSPANRFSRYLYG